MPGVIWLTRSHCLKFDASWLLSVSVSVIETLGTMERPEPLPESAARVACPYGFNTALGFGPSWACAFVIAMAPTAAPSATRRRAVAPINEAGRDRTARQAPRPPVPRP